MHGVADGLIPVDESRRLVAALHGQVPVRYAEFELFDHADPTRPLAALTLARELGRLLAHVRGLMRFASCEP
jgi:dipeptidyl aminopeptidase/acylaminoacyl peptidase